jgi:hypothetical protein
LYHLDFSECGLTADIISRIIKKVRDSTSLIGLHLTGNPGITPEMERRILNTLGATYEKELNLKSF